MVAAAGGLTLAALWGSRGHLPAFIRGQLPPEDWPPSDGPIAQPPPYRVQVRVDEATTLSSIDARFLSVAIDTSQLVGGRWWNPEASTTERGSGSVLAPSFDFERPRVVALARALAPAYVLYGGSEADSVYYDLEPDLKPAGAPHSAPEGYASTLTAAQWDRAYGFAEACGLTPVFTLNAGPSSRRSDGSWNSANAERLLRHMSQRGQRVAAFQLGNEPNIFWYLHGVRQHVSGAQYAADVAELRRLLAQTQPHAKVLGPGSAYWPVLGEPLGLVFGMMTPALQYAGQQLDGVTWHYYPQQSRRGPVASRRAHPARLLDPNALEEVRHWAHQIRQLRDQHAPGRPLWLSETGNAQFGGEPGVSDRYAGTLWWLDQLGVLAQAGHAAVVRQSLSGMNYGLLSEPGLEPRPDYWASLLWRQVMQPKVHAVRIESSAARLRAYAHSARGADSPMSLLLINLDPRRAASVELPQYAERPAQRFEVSSESLDSPRVMLNGKTLSWPQARDTPPELVGEWMPSAARVRVEPLSCVFLSL